MIVGRVVEADIVGVGIRPKAARFELIVSVMVFADVVTVPDGGEAVSQLGVVIEYFTLPNVELRV